MIHGADISAGRGKRSWQLKFDLGRDPITGKRRIQYTSFKGSRREAEIELARLVPTFLCE